MIYWFFYCWEYLHICLPAFLRYVRICLSVSFLTTGLLGALIRFEGYHDDEIQEDVSRRGSNHVIDLDRDVEKGLPIR